MNRQIEPQGVKIGLNNCREIVRNDNSKGCQFESPKLVPRFVASPIAY
jgi:hypothetical protein